MSRRYRIQCLLIGAAVLAAGLATYHLRRHYIRGFFVRSPGGAPAPALPTTSDQRPEAANQVGPSGRVRVILVDGLSRTLADALPEQRSLCQRGLSLTVDTGFPTVSLPIQSVLWTGLTQQQSGVEFIGVGLDPPLGGLPERVSDSVAIAESHIFITHSFRFASREPMEEPGKTRSDPWRAGEFRARAKAAVAGPARLAFVHVLAVDEAGHYRGGLSPAYVGAALSADTLIAELVAADPRPDTRWLLLSDHAHRSAGGHGGAEDSIRLSRACLFGAGISRGGGDVHMIDLYRVLADSLEVTPEPASAGRPLSVALAAPPSPGATLPAPGAARIAIAIALLALLWGVCGWLLGRRSAPAMLWLPVAYGALVLLHDWPTMSMPMVYRPLARDVYTAALPGLCLLAVGTVLSLRRLPPWRVSAGLFASGLAPLLALRVATWRTPPLFPCYTAHASVAYTLLYAACAVIGLALLTQAIFPGTRTRDNS